MTPSWPRFRIGISPDTKIEDVHLIEDVEQMLSTLSHFDALFVKDRLLGTLYRWRRDPTAPDMLRWSQDRRWFNFRTQTGGESLTEVLINHHPLTHPPYPSETYNGPDRCARCGHVYSSD